MGGNESFADAASKVFCWFVCLRNGVGSLMVMGKVRFLPSNGAALALLAGADRTAGPAVYRICVEAHVFRVIDEQLAG